MARPKQLVVINDFSSGEIDLDLKRGSDSVTMTGGRQMSNWRVLNSRKKANRPGRTALFPASGRIDEILMSPGNIFYLAFSAGALSVYNAAGTQVFTQGGMPWDLATVPAIVWAQTPDPELAIYICYADGAPNNVPIILTWDGVSQTSTWTFNYFAETVELFGQKDTPFYRIAPQGITLQPSATTGTVNITFSSPVLKAGMRGTRLEYCGSQLQIASISTGETGTAIVMEPLPPGQSFTASSLNGSISIGQEIIGETTGAKGVVVGVGAGGNQQILTMSIPQNNAEVGETITGATSGATAVVSSVPVNGGNTIIVTLFTSTRFIVGEVVNVTGGGNDGTTTAVSSSASYVVQVIPTTSDDIILFGNETVVGPGGSAVMSGAPTTIAPQAVSVWDQEVMNTYWGYPTSVFVDQGRLGFCNFPSVPSGIAWSELGLYGNFFVSSFAVVTADSAIFELAPGKSQVLYVQPGMESSEFVFCDNAIYYIPISQAQPLEPGSVAFTLMSTEGCYPVEPQPAEQTILYLKAGGLQVGAVQAPGAYYRPFVIDAVAEYHQHLFTASTPIAIAIPSASEQFQELYAYILMANGTIVMGRYAIRNGLLDVGPEGKPKIGWLPWSGAGGVQWISAQGADLIFVSYYPTGSNLTVVEKLDATQYLDCAIPVNNLPAAFTPPSGKGPLYEFPGPNASVYLIDQGTLFLGTYQVDANGWIIPQNQEGENLASTELIAGQPWVAVYEPFIPDAGAGPDQRQRTLRRKLVRAAISVENSTGFLYVGNRVPPYPQGATNPAGPAPLEEYTYRFRYAGSYFDPRAVLEKDAPGPLTVLEHAIEITI